MPIRVLLADDHPLIAGGLMALLRSQDDIEIVGCVADGRSAVQSAVALSADVAILDVSMPDMNGIEAAERILAARPATRVIMLSMHDSQEHVYRALRAGALAYVLKESAGTEIIAAVRSVLVGRRFISSRIQGQAALLERLGARSATSPLESLSKREREILQLVVEGHSSAEIARALALSPKTVDTYRSRLMQKLGLEDVPALVKFAVQHGVTGLK
ncbi:MAG TPA: response regulator transcription factor [Usitatibacter sp.]|nr:response regulator transcription factor [Usitatibacter sp.]